MKTRKELDIEQFKIKYEVGRIKEDLDKYKYGSQVLERIKFNLEIIKGELGL